VPAVRPVPQASKELKQRRFKDKGMEFKDKDMVKLEFKDKDMVKLEVKDKEDKEDKEVRMVNS
jgi:hypothetical protein